MVRGSGGVFMAEVVHCLSLLIAPLALTCFHPPRDHIPISCRKLADRLFCSFQVSGLMRFHLQYSSFIPQHFTKLRLQLNRIIFPRHKTPSLFFFPSFFFCKGRGPPRALPCSLQPLGANERRSAVLDAVGGCEVKERVELVLRSWL